MKRSLLPLFCGALLLLGLVAGCDTPPAHVPKTTRTFVLSSEQASPDVEMQLVSAIRVVLPGPEAGSELNWVIISNNNKVLDQMGPIKPVAPSQALGAGPASEVSFYALKPGKSVLRFYLINSKLAEAVPAAKCQLTVRVIN